MSLFAPSRAMAALAVVLIAVAALAGCTTFPTPGAARNGLVIENAFARPAPAGGDGGAFLTVVNGGGTADRLIAARSPIAPTIELHETINENGIMKMRHVPGGFEAPANGRLELKPGGKHIMFVGLTSPLEESKEVEITLVFEKAGEVSLKAPIRP